MKVYLTVFAFLQSLPSVHSSRLAKSAKDQEDKEERRVPVVIQVADLAKCSDTFYEHPAPDGDAQVLPLQIDVDRVFDVQWNPPGHPQLCASWLQTPFGDRWSDSDEPADLPGHYTFIKYHRNGKLGLVREKEDGTICSVFREVRFVSVSDDVLMMNGDPGPEDEAYGVKGGGYGTLVKGSNISSGNEDGCWDTTTPEESGLTGEQWLMRNFEVADTPQLLAW